MQITGLEPSTAFLFKSALYPCVIEFNVRKDNSSTAKTALGGASGGNSSVDILATPASAMVASAAAVAGALGSAVSGATGTDKDGNAIEAPVADVGGASVEGGGGGTSWLGQMKPKESSYKVYISLTWSLEGHC